MAGLKMEGAMWQGMLCSVRSEDGTQGVDLDFSSVRLGAENPAVPCLNF